MLKPDCYPQKVLFSISTYTRTIYPSFQRFEGSENRIFLLFIFLSNENLLCLVINNKLALYFVCMVSPLSKLLDALSCLFCRNNAFSCLSINNYTTTTTTIIIIIIIILLQKSFFCELLGSFSPDINKENVTCLIYFFPQIFL